MRYICLVAVLLALPLTANAQHKRAADRRSDQNQSEQRRSDAKRPATTQQPPWWERKQTPSRELNQIPGWENGNVARALLDRQRVQKQLHDTPRPNHRGLRRQYQPSVVYVLPAYRYLPESMPAAAQFFATPAPPIAPVPVEPHEPALPPMGALRLEVEPKESLQIFVDGVYVGTPADLGDEFELAPGTRRIELRAQGYRPLTFSVEIIDGRSITYRGSLDLVAASAAPRPPAPAAAAGSKLMYMIPGCYLGNVSPKTVTLPPGCDINNLKTITP